MYVISLQILSLFRQFIVTNNILYLENIFSCSNFASKFVLGMIENTKFFSRSLYSSIVDTWKILTVNWKSYVKYQIRYTILIGTCFAMLTSCILLLIIHDLLPLFYLSQQGVPLDMIISNSHIRTFDLVLLILSLIIYYIGSVYWKGNTFNQLYLYKTSEKWSKVENIQMYRGIWKLGMKLQLISSFLLAITVLICLLISFLAFWTNVWYCLLWIPVLLFMCVNNHRVLRSIGLQKLSIKESLTNVLFSQRGWLQDLILIILSYFLIGLLLLMINIPIILLSLSALIQAQSHLMGDTTSTPNLFVFFLIGIICFTLSYFVLGLIYWPLSLRCIPKHQ